MKVQIFKRVADDLKEKVSLFNCMTIKTSA